MENLAFSGWVVYKFPTFAYPKRTSNQIIPRVRGRLSDYALQSTSYRDNPCRVNQNKSRQTRVAATWKWWQNLCDRRGKDYRSFKSLHDDADHKAHMVLPNYAPEIHDMRNSLLQTSPVAHRFQCKHGLIAGGFLSHSARPLVRPHCKNSDHSTNQILI